MSSSPQADSINQDQPIQPANSYNWLFIDLNSYFASVEQQIQPILRKKPIAVCAVMADSSACIAASYEAKAFGVKTGTRIGEAKRMCPGLILVKAQHEIYVDYHQKIIEAIERCHPITSVHSIDEVALRLSGRDRNEENALALARDIKKSIYSVGSELGCSIGISTNRFLSKLASDMQKPNGLILLSQRDLPHKLLHLKLRDIPGIGSKMEERLHRHNIRDMHQLLALDVHSMREIWGGIWGERMHKWLRGNDFDVENGKNKSFSHEHVLPPNLRNPDGAFAIAQKLLLKGAVRLRQHHLWASRLYVGLRYIDQHKWSQEIKMLECQDSLTLLEALQLIWKEVPRRSAPLKVNIALLNLIDDKERTFSLFENTKRLRLSQAVDSLNMRYGRNTVYFGGVHNIKAAAPTRIAFSSIPDFTV